MIFPLVLLVALGVFWGLVRWQRRQAGRSFWSRVVVPGLVIGLGRVVCFGVGAYVLGSTSGWLQLPAYAMVLVGLPEIALVRRGGALAGAPLLIVAGTFAWVGLAAAVAAGLERRARSARSLP